MPKRSSCKCYFRCDVDGPLHKFPASEYPHTERFNKWKEVLHPITQEKGNKYIVHSVRLCSRHFENYYKSEHSPVLTRNAVPTLNIDYKNVPLNKDATSSNAPGTSETTDETNAKQTSHDTSTGATQDSSKQIKEAPLQTHGLVDTNSDTRTPVSVPATTSQLASVDGKQMTEEQINSRSLKRTLPTAQVTTSSSTPIASYSNNTTRLDIPNNSRTIDLTYKQANSTIIDDNDINIRMHYAYSLDYDEDLFDVKADDSQCKGAKRTRKLVKLKPIKGVFHNNVPSRDVAVSTADYEVEVLDGHILLDDEFDIASKDQQQDAVPQLPTGDPHNQYEFELEVTKEGIRRIKKEEPPQTNHFSWQQEGVEVQDADLAPDPVPQLPTADLLDSIESEWDIKKEGIQIKKEERSSSAKPDCTSDEKSNYHQGYQCNICSSDIKGFRYVCVQCADFDLCGACEARRAHDSHYVLRIPGPRPHSEIQATLRVIRCTLMDAIVHVVNNEPIEVKDEEDCLEDPIGLQPPTATAARVITPHSDHDWTESDDASSQMSVEEILDETDHTTVDKLPQNVRIHRAAKSDERDQNLAKSDHIIADSDQIIADDDQNVVKMPQQVPVMKRAEKAEKSFNTREEEGSTFPVPVLINKSLITLSQVTNPLLSNVAAIPRRVLNVSALPATVRSKLVFYTKKLPEKLVRMNKARVMVERMSEQQILTATHGYKRLRPEHYVLDTANKDGVLRPTSSTK